MDRLRHALLVRALADRRAGVVDAVGDHRPAVVDAGAHDVDLVAAARAVLVQPRDAGLRVDGQTLRVAMAVAEDLGPRARDADERIVLGHAAVRMQPDHLAVILAQVLRAIALPALADGDEQMALRVERQTRAEVFASSRPAARR